MHVWPGNAMKKRAGKIVDTVNLPITAFTGIVSLWIAEKQSRRRDVTVFLTDFQQTSFFSSWCRLVVVMTSPPVIHMVIFTSGVSDALVPPSNTARSFSSSCFPAAIASSLRLHTRSRASWQKSSRLLRAAISSPNGQLTFSARTLLATAW